MWYLGAMNDALFIINTPPRTSNDYVWHDRPDGPTLVLGPFVGREGDALAKSIIDAHNSELERAGFVKTRGGA